MRLLPGLLLLSCCLGAVGALAAQRAVPVPTPPPPRPMPPPLIPTVPPPVDHPGYLGQPGITGQPQPDPAAPVPGAAPGGGKGPAGPKGGPAGPKGPGAKGAGAKGAGPKEPGTPEELAEHRAAAFLNTPLAGSALHNALTRADKELRWETDLEAAIARATASNRPLLWLQAQRDDKGALPAALPALRAFAFADPMVIELLQQRFVLFWHPATTPRAIDRSAGRQWPTSVVGLPNGHGSRHVQLLVLAPDRTVLHALPGFWHPDDLRTELHFALQVHELWRDRSRPAAAREHLLQAMRRVLLASWSLDYRARCQPDEEDRAAEVTRSRTGSRDTIVRDGKGDWVLDEDKRPVLKPVGQVVHERLQRQGLLPLERFDLDGLIDYGR